MLLNCIESLFQISPEKTITAFPNDENMFEWVATIRAPTKSVSHSSVHLTFLDDGLLFFKTFSKVKPRMLYFGYQTMVSSPNLMFTLLLMRCFVTVNITTRKIGYPLPFPNISLPFTLFFALYISPRPIF